MSWLKFSCSSLSGFLGSCIFFISPAWAGSANLAEPSKMDSSENIRMEKIIYPKEMVSQVPEALSRVRSNNDAEAYSVGERYFPVLLVSTSDFKALDSAFMHRMFNEEGFKENGAYGSVRDYFISSSGGLSKPTYDIYPITLSNSFSSFQNAESFITSALDILVERADFKSHANKYEKEIPFIILHPLSSDTAEKINSRYFNHQYSLQNSAGRAYSKNGYKFNSYVFVSQKAEKKPNSVSTKDVNMLGSFIHELSHMIGLADTYSKDSRGYATVGPLAFDVMALGLRNGNGGYPPTFSAFEREAMGWLKLTEIENRDSVYELKKLSEMQAYAVSNPNQPNEYFVIEYRPAVGFDSKIGNSTYSGKQGKNGVLVWYIDYDVDAFDNNNPNGDLNHQRVEVRSVLGKNQDNFTDFKFVNKNGKAKIDGIFNIVFDGDDRVCFTVNRSKSLDKCPEKIASSSSAAVESMSSAAVVSSSSATDLSSSSGKTSLFAASVVANVQIHASRGILNVEVPLAGAKTLRFYDALGNVVSTVLFEKSSIVIDVSGWNRSVFMQLDVNGKRLFAKQVKFR